MNDRSRRIESREIETSSHAATIVESTIIPSSFWLGGLKINVEFDDSLVRTKQCIGEARYSKQMITLDPSVAPLQMLEQSYCHELVHWIFYVMGEEELRNNERIVDLFAHFLYQARMTEKRLPIPAEIADSGQGE
jgi:hypothetical protein